MFEQKLTEDKEFTDVVFIKVDCDELEVCTKPSMSVAFYHAHKLNIFIYSYLHIVIKHRRRREYL